MLSSRPQLPVLILTLVLPLSAQGQEGDKAAARSGSTVGKNTDSDKSSKAATPIRSNFAASGTIAMKPRRLGPTQSGELCFLIMLKDNLVALPGILPEVSFTAGDCPCTLGGQTVDPPSLGTMDNRYRGKKIHEETVIVRMPIRIRKDAALKRYPVEAIVRFMVHDATSGQLVGKLEKRVRGSVHVGKPLPTFDARNVDKTDSAAPGPSPHGSRPPGTDKSPSPRRTAGELSPNAQDALAQDPLAQVSPTNSSSGQDEPGQTEPSAPAGGEQDRGGDASDNAGRPAPAAPKPPRRGSFWSWLLGGAGAISLVFVLLLRRRGA